MSKELHQGDQILTKKVDQVTVKDGHQENKLWQAAYSHWTKPADSHHTAFARKMSDFDKQLHKSVEGPLHGKDNIHVVGFTKTKAGQASGILVSNSEEPGKVYAVDLDGKVTGKFHKTADGKLSPEKIEKAGHASGSGNQSDIKRDAKGNVTHVKRGDGTETEYGYDNTKHPSQLNHWKQGADEYWSNDGGKHWWKNKQCQGKADSNTETTVDSRGVERNKLADGSINIRQLDGSQRTIIPAEPKLVIVDRDNKGNITHVARANGTETEYGYDNSKNPPQLNHWKQGTDEYWSNDAGKNWWKTKECTGNPDSTTQTWVDSQGCEHRIGADKKEVIIDTKGVSQPKEQQPVSSTVASNYDSRPHGSWNRPID
jgi:hypothetical protein